MLLEKKMTPIKDMIDFLGMHFAYGSSLQYHIYAKNFLISQLLTF